jgi:hydrogenase expression/formation protein HypD
MKHVEEYRDATLAKALLEKIRKTVTRPIRLMEICGTHTVAIFRHGIRSLLPESIELLSGPGCPVCVTAMEEVDRSIKLAGYPEVILTTFGDMLRVPGSFSSLDQERGKGADVRMVYSTFDAIRIAEQCSDKEVVFLGIGFETTAPTVAAAIAAAQQKGLSNFSVLCAHKLLPPAMHALLRSGDISIDGFICPGHVTTIIGTSAYAEVVAEYAIPCVVVGFEPIDILQGILMLAEQVVSGRAAVEIQYTRGVSEEGNQAALRLMDRIFEPCDASWRGLGAIRKSGLAIRKSYGPYDATTRFDVSVPPAQEPPGCLCAQVLRGAVRPPDCRLFRKACSPRTPVGPCMVSSEGTCAAYFKYHTA